jgi:outer membrane protein OmpU
MKRLLLGTTALMAAVAIGAPAQAADPIKLSLGGYFQAYWGYASRDDGVGRSGENRRNHGFYREGEIYFRGETELDNGITVGVNVQLEAEACADQIDESYVYFEGAFGRLEFGARDGAHARTHVFNPSAFGGGGPDFATVIWPNTPAGNQVGSVVTYGGYFVSGDREKVSYFTPRIGGLQVGISYMPERCEAGGGNCGSSRLPEDNTTGQQSEIVEIGGNFKQKFGDVNFSISAGASSGDLEAQNAEATLEGQNDWSVHANLGFGAFTIGAGYREDDQGKTGDTNIEAWAVSGSYRMNAWTFGVGYANQAVGAGAGLGKDELSVFGGGVNYAYGPGMSLRAGVKNYDWHDNTSTATAEQTATTVTVGTRVNF